MKISFKVTRHSHSKNDDLVYIFARQLLDWKYGEVNKVYDTSYLVNGIAKHQ